MLFWVWCCFLEVQGVFRNTLHFFSLALNGWIGIKRFPVGFKCGSFSRRLIYHQPKKGSNAFYNVFPQYSKSLGVTPIRRLFFFFGKTTPQPHSSCWTLWPSQLENWEEFELLKLLSNDTWFNWNLCVNKLRYPNIQFVEDIAKLNNNNKKINFKRVLISKPLGRT